MRRKWVVVTAVVALLAFAVTGGTLLAQHSGDGDSDRKSLADRVADILGLDSGTVEDAFSEAQNDIADESLEAKLKKLVEHEVIDQPKADEILAWFKDRPEGTPLRLLGGGRHKRGFGGHFRGHMFNHDAPADAPVDDTSQARLFGNSRPFGGSFTGARGFFAPSGPSIEDDIQARILGRLASLAAQDS
ncbi:MAG: hypothetical protein IH956_09510 [Chloroflexi bacterium]|nr:hypothetical protein [Chloroflexota bacterium]